MQLTILHSERPKLYAINHIALRRPKLYTVNPIALRKAKIVCNFGLSECNRATESFSNCDIKIFCLYYSKVL